MLCNSLLIFIFTAITAKRGRERSKRWRGPLYIQQNIMVVFYACMWLHIQLSRRQSSCKCTRWGLNTWRSAKDSALNQSAIEYVGSLLLVGGYIQHVIQGHAHVLCCAACICCVVLPVCILCCLYVAVVLLLACMWCCCAAWVYIALHASILCCCYVCDVVLSVYLLSKLCVTRLCIECVHTVVCWLTLSVCCAAMYVYTEYVLASSIMLNRCQKFVLSMHKYQTVNA